MGRKEELELELSDARKERDRNYELKSTILRKVSEIGDDTEDRIKRIEQYFLSGSMAEKDKVEYADKRMATIKRRSEFEEAMEDFKKRIDKQCEESDYKVQELENSFCEISEDDKEEEEQ